jgi:hypothetical protein
VLDRAEHRLGGADERKVILARHLDEPGSRDACSQEPRPLDGDCPIARAVEDERRDLDAREHVAHVVLAGLF